MTYYPIFIDLNHKKVLIIGAGEIAQRKIIDLLRSNAKILLVAKKIKSEYIKELIKKNKIKLIANKFNPKQIKKVSLVIAATNDDNLNKKIFTNARKQKKLCNIVDNKKLCDFISPATIDRSPLQIAISTGGNSPIMARIIKQKIANLFPENIGNFIELIGKYRIELNNKFDNISQKRHFWEKVLENIDLFLIKNDIKGLEEQIIKYINNENAITSQGMVSLVGAGPGDAELITIKGLKAIQEADVVLYDFLISKDLLKLVRKDAKLIFTGKKAGVISITQEEINKLLVFYAQKRLKVVRLKGGDPMIFGRGAEEALVLKKHNIPFVIIPGISSGIAGPTYAGIPLTHRDYTQTITFLTGNFSTKENKIDWSSLISDNQTIIIYMGLKCAAKIKDYLINQGKNPKTPVAIIQNATLPTQTIITGLLENLDKLAMQIGSPALIIISFTVNLYKDINWFSSNIKSLEP